MLAEDIKRNHEIKELISKSGFSEFEIGVAIVDLKERESKIFGHNMDHFIYPASVYKVFIGAEVLRKVEAKELSLEELVEVRSPNDVDRHTNLFPGDSRGLLKAGDTVSVDYLLDLMLTRSDNTSSNVLIDLVGRENISARIVDSYGWKGSEITRKFLDRSKEDTPYRYSETTKTCARHMAEFMYLIEKGKLISPFVSEKMREYMLRWNRGGRQGLTLTEYLFVYRKGGYLENNLYQGVYKNYYHKSGFGLEYARTIWRLLKNIFLKGWAFICWQNDIAVITGQNSHYVAAVFTVTKSLNPRKRFPMQHFAKILFDYMESRENRTTPN